MDSYFKFSSCFDFFFSKFKLKKPSLLFFLLFFILFRGINLVLNSFSSGSRGKQPDSFKACYKLFAVLCASFYPTFTLNKYPTSADNPMATVPQKLILIIALPILEPPVLADNAPKRIRKRIAKP